MKKKILSMALVLVMVASMLPLGGLFVSAAEPTYAENTVALVNGVETSAADLLTVIGCCKTGGTIEIVKDFTTFGIVLQAYEGTTCKWVFDGNGHTISSPLAEISNGNYLVTVGNSDVEIKDVTFKTMGSGIKVKDGAKLELTNVNLYTGGTKEGTNYQDAENRPSYVATQSTAQLCSKGITLSSSRALVVINSGIYKAYGAGAVVLEVSQGNMVINNGSFIGEDASFVARVWNSTKQKDLSSVTASLTIYNGEFIKPVIIKKALQRKAGDTAINGCSTGGVIRGDAGGIVNIHGGTFANFSGKVIDASGNPILSGSNREWVLLSGTSQANSKEDVGFINVFGGDFYSFMTADVIKDGPQVIGNQTVKLDGTSDVEKAKINASIYAGNFYSINPTREENITRIAEKETTTLQQVPFDQYTAVKTALTEPVTVYGRQMTGVTKWAFTYNQPSSAPTGATVKVTNSNGKEYYLSDYSFTSSTLSITVNVPAFVKAINCVADKNSTVTLLKDITVPAAEVLNRGQKMTIDGDNKNVTCSNYGITVSSGQLTLKNLTITSAGSYALKIAKTAVNEENITVDPFTLELVLQGCALNGAVPVVNNTVLEGTLSATNCTAHGSALTLSHTYTAPAPTAPDLSLLEGEEDDGGDTGTGDTGTTETPTTDAPATDAPATDAPAADAEKKGCKNSIGVGAVAVLAVAGLACGIVSKKRED
ncbi:MAG: hypothetical protein E7653_07230 [Ruminococcaceae bacterium]|nr:hypothetical protein [Oscillospiraceae bacterium]